jgi:hypothetical protein
MCHTFIVYRGFDNSIFGLLYTAVLWCYNTIMTQHVLHTLSNTAVTRLTPNGTHSGMDFTIQNVNDTGYIYIGGTETLSSTNYGFRIMPNHSISFELPPKDALFAIASANGMQAAVIKMNLESLDK